MSVRRRGYVIVLKTGGGKAHMILTTPSGQMFSSVERAEAHWEKVKVGYGTAIKPDFVLAIGDDGP